jgi:hypothetical protein
MSHTVRYGTRYLAALSLLGASLLANASGLTIPEISDNTTLVISNGGGETLFRHGHRTSVQVVSGNGNTVVSGSSGTAPVSVAHVPVKADTVLAACPSPVVHTGDARVRREYPLYGAVDTVALSAPANVCIQEGPAVKVTVVADEKLQALLVPSLTHGALNVIPSATSWSASHTPAIIVTVPHLTKLRAYAGGSIRLQDLHGDHLELLTSNGTKVTGTGAFRSLHADVSEGSTVTSPGLHTEAADVDVSEGASFYGSVSGNLRVRASDGARVHIVGNPNVLSSENTGGGSVVIQ